jgi:hypothetical protein
LCSQQGDLGIHERKDNHLFERVDVVAESANMPEVDGRVDKHGFDVCERAAHPLATAENRRISVCNIVTWLDSVDGQTRLGLVHGHHVLASHVQAALLSLAEVSLAVRAPFILSRRISCVSVKREREEVCQPTVKPALSLPPRLAAP